MYFRKKTSGGRAYLQIVESRRDGAQVRQQVIATLGRIEDLRDSGQLERLLRSGARFAAKAIVVNAVAEGAVTASAARRIGPALVFERLWEETGCRQVIEDLAGSRKHGFPLERAVFLTVLHRLFAGGSDRAADRWREDYAIDGAADIDLHHLYRAMAWLGEELSEDQQDGATLFAPRCLKDVIEEELFARRRNLFSKLDLVFMDTTSLYFEGAGGQTLGQRGFSKDHRPEAFRRGVRRADFRGQRGVHQGARRSRPLHPRVIAAGGDAQDAAHHGDGVTGPVLAHELEPFGGITSVSRANQAAAFERISRSNLSWRISRRRRLSSSRSAISDWKNDFLPQCDRCEEKPRCSGFFTTGRPHYSRGIEPLCVPSC